MSFKVAISDVLIANEALALLPADPIVSMAEQSLEARECRRFYKPVVAELLEQHHWGLAAKRATLAAKPNDRAGEWAYAYAKPADMAFPVKAFGAGNVYAGWYYHDGLYSMLGGQRVFRQVGGTIYSMIPAATLEYTSFDITEADFTALFKRIVVLELAARIVSPITKSSTRMRELIAQSEAERQRAIANDMNRDQPTYGNRPSESEMARNGLYAGYGIGARPLDPVADPIGAVIVPDGAPPGDFYYEG